MLQNERVSIYYGTKEAYEVEKQNKRINENALYFIEGVLYSGYELYTQEYHKVTSYPSIGQKNYIYINTLDSSVAIWDDDTSEWLYLSKSTVGVDEAINELKAEIEELSEITAEEIKTNQSELESHTKNNVVHITNDERELWDDKYTKVEIDNKFSAFETNIDWKETVNTYDDIVITYPNPKDGWTVNVKDTDYTYRYNGTEWVTISANATPKATNEVDGLLSKEDHAKYEEAYNQKHSHSNKSILDTITSAIIDTWNSAVAHISDTVKHITSTERTNWNDANDKKHTHSNKSILDNTTASYTTAEQIKLDGIANDAEVNQNAFSNVVVGSTTIYADSKTDTLTLVAGSNVTITPDATNDRITISSTNTTYSNATTSTAGLMSASDKTKLDGIASGANKTTLVTNLTTSTVGYALDATMGKDLYNYIRMLQTDVVYLKYLTNALTEDFVEAKYIKNHSHSELGSVNVAYMPYEKMTTLTTSNKVIVGFTNGAVSIFSVDVAAGNTLGRTITWIRGSVPYVSKTTIQSGTNTLALASGSGAYTMYDREIYLSTGENKQTLVFEFSAVSSDISVFYKIINMNDGFNSLSETETDVLM